MNEYAEAKRLAERVLDKPYIDPDGDICLLARQFLRVTETIETIATHGLSGGAAPLCRAAMGQKTEGAGESP